MGLRINSVNSVLRPAAQRVGLRFPATAGDDTAIRGVSAPGAYREGEGRYANPPGFRGTEDGPRLGFGPGTVSPAGAAASTIRRQVDEMRVFAPNLREMFARVRSGSGDSDPRTGVATETAEPPEPVSRAMNRAAGSAVVGARDFINSLSAAAQAARARVEGAESDAGRSRPLRMRPMAERLSGYRPTAGPYFSRVDFRA
jgi:hypothetical protein